MAAASRERSAPPLLKADRALPADVPVLIEIEGGVRIAVPNDYWAMSTWVLAEQEDWFEPELAFLRGVVEPGWRILDVGANHGVYAASLASRVGPHGQVVAIEPQAAVVDRLRLTARDNGLGGLVVVRSAVAEAPGTLELFGGINSELASLIDDGSGVAERVPVATLPALARAHALDRPDLIKIDVEGVEERVLAGAAGWLDDAQPLVMFEIGKDEARNRRLIRWFEALGYRCYQLVPGLAALAPLGAVPWSPFTLNLFACPPARAAALEAQGHLIPAPPLLRRLPPDWYEIREQLLAALDPSLDKPARLRAALTALGDPACIGTRLRDWSAMPERLFAIARLCWLLGLREGSLAAVSPLLDRFAERPWGLTTAPFWPQPRFDAAPPRPPADGAGIAALDAAVWSMAFSGYFVTRAPARPIEALRDDPWFDAHLERRCQLWRTRAGLQDGLVGRGPLVGRARNRHLLA